MAFSSSPIAHAIATGTNGADTSGTPIDTSTANLLVGSGCWFDGTTANLTAGDSKFNTWTPGTRYNNGALVGRIWYAAGTPTVGTGHTFNFTGSGTFPALQITAWSGADASPFDQESGAGASSPGTITPSQDDSLLIAAFGSTGPAVYSVNGGFTISDQTPFTGGAHEGGAQAYLVQTTAAAANPTWSNGSTDVSALMAFKPATGGGGGNVGLLIRSALLRSVLTNGRLTA